MVCTKAYNITVIPDVVKSNEAKIRDLTHYGVILNS